MGWTFMQSKPGPLREFFQRQATGTIHESHITTNAAYLAYQRDGSADVIALVILIKRTRDGFGWKVMDEGMQPFYYDASEKVLARLTPVDQLQEQSDFWKTGAAAWRAECAQRATNDLRKIPVGTTIRTTEQLSFGRYGTADTFTRTDPKRAHFFAPQLGITVRLSNTHTWTIAS